MAKTNLLPVINLRKPLTSKPAILSVSDIVVRHYRDKSDIDSWLHVRNAAFVGLKRGSRVWTHSDFRREFLSRWWWQPSRLWLAENRTTVARSTQVIGVIGLAARGQSECHVPVVHWLAVDPAAQRVGVAALLLSHLEATVWNLGGKELYAQTHVAWQAAVAFYKKHGFQRHEGNQAAKTRETA